MRSINPPGTQSSTIDADLTAKARVREAAMLLFGAEGFESVSVRQVAARAGVSPALVMHHFGSKDELREACDDHAVAFMATKGTGDSAVGDSAAVGDLLNRIGDYGRYIARMVTDGSPAGNTLFDRLLDQTRHMVADEMPAGRMRPSADPEALARVLVMQSLAPLVLHCATRASRRRGTLSPQTLHEIAVPTAEIYSRGLFTTSDLVNAVTGTAPI